MFGGPPNLFWPKISTQNQNGLFFQIWDSVYLVLSLGFFINSVALCGGLFSNIISLNSLFSANNFDRLYFFWGRKTKVIWKLCHRGVFFQKSNEENWAYVYTSSADERVNYLFSTNHSLFSKTILINGITINQSLIMPQILFSFMLHFMAKWFPIYNLLLLFL